MQQSSTLGNDIVSLDVQIKRSIQALLSTPTLPERIRKDVQQVAIHTLSDATKNVPADKARRLLHIYEITLKILLANGGKTPLESVNKSASIEQVARLNDALQDIITELDFEGEYGERLVDIRAKLLLGSRGDELIELTLDVLKLVALGTDQERQISQQFLEKSYDCIGRISINTEQINDKSRDIFVQRKEINTQLRTLIKHKYSSLADEQDPDTLRQNTTEMMKELSHLSERYTSAEAREQILLEQLAYAKRQIDNLNDSTKEHRRRIDEKNQRLRRDSLTKVYNRTTFIEILETEYRRWIGNQHPLRMALFDIDDFSYVNNHFGYTAGDKALKIISRAINQELKSSDILARFSGEEFILLMPARTDEQATELIESIQTRVAALPFKFRDRSLKITLSAASKAFEQGDTPEILLEQLSNQLTAKHEVKPSQLIWL
ncbi:MAG: GGDEF domain-containing protein [Vibrio sp.]